MCALEQCINVLFAASMEHYVHVVRIHRIHTEKMIQK